MGNPDAGDVVGRDAELSRLRATWTDVAAGGQATVLVTGDPGTGKSRLVAAALAEFTPRPVRVLHGNARLHSPAPYDWLAAVLCTHEPVDSPIPPDALAWLAQHPDTPRERYAPDALLRMAVRLVRSLVGPGPAVLVVEDVHGLDPASLNLIAELATAPALPVLLLATSRPPERANSLVARTLSRLSGAPGSVRLHLGPLDREDVAALLAATYREPVPPATVDAVYDETGGNPYRLTELVARCRSLDELASPEPIGLTARETEVLSCLANGMSNKQIAQALGISIRTVTVHVSNLLRKTGAASRTEVAVRAARRPVSW